MPGEYIATDLNGRVTLGLAVRAVRAVSITKSESPRFPMTPDDDSDSQPVRRAPVRWGSPSSSSAGSPLFADR